MLKYTEIAFSLHRVTNATQAGKLYGGLPGLKPFADRWFLEGVTQDTGHEFERSRNGAWLRNMRLPIAALFRARYYPKIAIRCGKNWISRPSAFPTTA